ncbi:hypothetical protein D3C71_1631980 [compost metagenome]
MPEAAHIRLPLKPEKLQVDRFVDHARQAHDLANAVQLPAHRRLQPAVFVQRPQRALQPVRGFEQRLDQRLQPPLGLKLPQPMAPGDLPVVLVQVHHVTSMRDRSNAATWKSWIATLAARKSAGAGVKAGSVENASARSTDANPGVRKIAP